MAYTIIMFTGIIEEVGTIESLKSLGNGIRLRVFTPKLAGELSVNDSISINGVCETVVLKDRSFVEVEAVEETLKKTTFSVLRPGDKVNLELPMRLNGRLGGHLVLGHVDTVGEIINIEERENSSMFSIALPHAFLHYVVPVGSIALDGVSLTVAELEGNVVRVSIIPHTMEHTIFRYYKNQDRVNLEFDILGKYVEQFLLHKPAGADSLPGLLSSAVGL
jgi:riboflavin synthase